MPPNGEAGPVVLRLNALTKRFGAITANDKISLALKRGEILALFRAKMALAKQP